MKRKTIDSLTVFSPRSPELMMTLLQGKYSPNTLLMTSTG